MAATSVLKLVVDDKEYSASLKNAKQGMQDLQTSLQSAGKSFLDVDNKVVEYARALGQMDTVSKTAKGRIGEMSSTFVELSVQYKHMTDQEKQSPVGKALAESLGTLKTRVIDAKNELKEFEDQLREVSEVKIDTKSGGGGLFGGGKLDGMLQVFGGNLMTKGASMLAGLAADMGDMVTQGIEMAEAGEGIRIAFERLNQPGLLDNLREATHGTVTNLELMKAAVKFNDFKLPVEELGTMLAFAQQKAKDTGQSVDYMVDSIVTGLGRKSLMILDNLGLSATEVKEKMKETGDMTKAVGEIISEQMSKAGDYVETAAERATRADVDLKNAMEDLGRTFQPLSDTGTSMFNSLKVSALNLLNDAVKPLIQAFTQLGAVQKIQDNVNGGGFMGRITNNLRNANNKDFVYSQQMMAINRAINRAQSNLNEAEKGGKGSIEIYRNRLQALINIKNEYERVAQSIMKAETDIATGGDGSTTGGGSGKGGGGKGGSGKTTTAPTYAADSIAAQSALVSDLRKKWSEAGEAVRNDLLVQLIAAEDKLKSMNNQSALFRENQQGKLLGNTPDGNAIQTTGLGSISIAEQINEASKGLQGDALKAMQNLIKGGNDAQKSWKNAASAIGSVGSALAGINNPAAKIMGIVAEAVANIALGFAMATAKDSKLGVFGWIAAIAGGLGTMMSTISAIHSATGYAEGGVVAGNTFSGDQIPAMLNAGEVVLNRAQTGALASQLQDGSRGMNIHLIARGTQLVAVIDNTLKTTGRGELLTWK